MKSLCLFFLGTFFFSAAYAQNTVSNYYQFLSDYTLDFIPQNIGGDVVLGKGVNLSDPSNPRISTYTAFTNSTTVPSKEETINASTINQATSIYLENQSDIERAKSLYFNFKIAFGFIGGFEAAYSQVMNEKYSHHAIQCIIQSTTTAPSIRNEDLKWNRTVLPGDRDVNIRRQNFIDKYGTHFIQSITYGFRIAIEGKIESTDVSNRSSFSAAFKAWSASGGANVSSSEILKSSNVSLTCVITAGKITPRGSMVITGFDDISTFLKDFKSGKIQLTNAPVSCNLKTYRSTLDEYPSTQEIFRNPEDNTKIKAPFGIPKGTILAWYPDQSAYRVDQKGVKVVTPPEGFALCDGSDAYAPNLNGRFLRGTLSVESTGQGGPEPANPIRTASITGTYVKNVSDHDWGNSAIKDVQFMYNLSSTVNVLPPYKDVIYIIKL